MRVWKIGAMLALAVLMIISVYVADSVAWGLDLRPPGLVAAGYFLGKWFTLNSVDEALRRLRRNAVIDAQVNAARDAARK